MPLVLLGRKKGIKNIGQNILFDAGAGIPHGHHDQVVLLIQGNINEEIAALIHGLDGIDEQVDQHLLNLRGVHRDRRQIIVDGQMLS